QPPSLLATQPDACVSRFTTTRRWEREPQADFPSLLPHEHGDTVCRRPTTRTAHLVRDQSLSSTGRYFSLVRVGACAPSRLSLRNCGGMPPRFRCATNSATMLTAISGTVWEPMS